MTLSDQDIMHYRSIGKIVIDPWEQENLQPASVDVRLGPVLGIPIMRGKVETRVIDPRVSQLLQQVPLDETYTLEVGQFILGHTLERVEVSEVMAARIEGKSSLGRLGLTVHSTAGFIDPGFRGFLTLEIKNNSTWPIILYEAMPIAQISFYLLNSPAVRPYGSPGLRSKYQDQEGPTPSRAWTGGI